MKLCPPLPCSAGVLGFGGSGAVAGMSGHALPLDQQKLKVWLSLQKSRVTAIVAELLLLKAVHAFGSWMLPSPNSPQVLCL